MPQIGWFELILVILVAILIIGPKEFPIVLKKIGSFIGSVKRYVTDFQSNVNEITNIEEDSKKDNELKNKEDDGK